MNCQLYSISNFLGKIPPTPLGGQLAGGWVGAAVGQAVRQSRGLCRCGGQRVAQPRLLPCHTWTLFVATALLSALPASALKPYLLEVTGPDVGDRLHVVFRCRAPAEVAGGTVTWGRAGRSPEVQETWFTEKTKSCFKRQR